MFDWSFIPSLILHERSTRANQFFLKRHLDSFELDLKVSVFCQIVSKRKKINVMQTNYSHMELK